VTVNTVLLLVAVLAGSSMQRITGMGFALVAAPFLVLLLGPVDGVIVVNVCGALTAAAVLVLVVRDVDWRRYALLSGCAVLGIVPGAFVVRLVPASWLEIGIGALVIVGLTVSLALGRLALRHSSRGLALAAATSGFMNTTAGVGGPAISIYAVATSWSQRSFAATMQPYFFTIGAASLVAKFTVGSERLPPLSPWIWAAIAIACLAGLVIGELVAKVMEPRIARRLLVVVAYLGSIATIARGIWGG